jgi:hypothetical protein
MIMRKLALLSALVLLATPAAAQFVTVSPVSSQAPYSTMDRCFAEHDTSSPVCRAGCHYQARTQAEDIACDQPDLSAAEGDLAWQIHLKANSDFVTIDGKLYLRMNAETMALWQLLHKEH